MQLINRYKNILACLLVIILASCKGEIKNDHKPENLEGVNDSIKTAKQSDGLILFTGKFLYLADAAVLETETGIYGVVLNDKMHELNDKVGTYKKEDTDFVPVAIRGELIPKPEGEEGWDYNIDIKEIIKVYEPNPDEEEDIIKIGN